MKKKEKKQNAGQPLQTLTAGESVSEDSLSVVFEDHTPYTNGWVSFNFLKFGEWFLCHKPLYGVFCTVWGRIVVN
jgi:hypothetical protein